MSCRLPSSSTRRRQTLSTHRRRRWFTSQSWLPLLLGLVCACSALPQPAPPPPLPSPSTTASPTSPAAPPQGSTASPGDAVLVPVHAAVVVAALPSLPHRLLRRQREYRVADTGNHLAIAVPQVPNLPVLNQRLRKVADHWARSFRQVLRKEDRPGRYHAMTVGWQLLARSKATVGLQLWVSQQHGLTVTLNRAAIWYDLPTATVLGLADLFARTSWPSVEQAITTTLHDHTYKTAAVRAALGGHRRSEGDAPAFGFAGDGDLLVTFGAHTLASNRQPVTVRLAGDPLARRLSTAGRSAGSAGQGAWTTRVAAKRVDCARRKCVALTFDDGPGSFTAELVSVLRSRQVPATFFLVGDRVRQAPDLVALVDDTGMEVGNHSSHHDDLTFLNAQEMRDDLQATSHALSAVTGRRPLLLRPPYGARNAAVDKVSKRLRLAEVLWDVDTLDWRYPNPTYVRRAAVEPATRGSIILLHDIHRTTVDAVPAIVDDLQRRGYTLVTVSQLLVKHAKPGRVYRRQTVVGR